MVRVMVYRFLFFALIIMFPGMGVVTGQRVTGQSASEAFSRGEYQKAYDQYMILLESFPRDPLYLYGAGASLVNMNRLPSVAAELIEKALGSTSAIRSIPTDAHYYHGRALHLSGRFDDALKAYEQFTAAAGRREARALGVPDLIREVRDRRGALTGSEIASQVERTDVRAVEKADSLPVREVRPPEMLSVKSDTLLGAALRQRQIADSLQRDTRPDTGSLRQSSTALLKSDSLMATAGLPVRIPDTSVVEQAREVVEIKADTVKVTAAADQTAKDDLRAATLIPPVAEKPLTSLFEVKKEPYYTSANPITVSSSFPPGLYYSIQMAVFRNPVAPGHFKGLYPVFGIKAAGSDLTYYYSGLFRSAAAASKALPEVRNQGFRDAFVVIFMDGKSVSAERGALLEKDWGTRGFAEWKGVVPETTVRPALPVDTVPPTLLFRVEVMRSNKRIDQRQLNDLERIAADKGLEILNPSSSVFVYIVGKFLTFESASAYADLLVRNGYKEARVAAYLGPREIPVETALKFFDR